MKPQWKQQCMKQQVTGPSFTLWCDLVQCQTLLCKVGQGPCGPGLWVFLSLADNKMPSCALLLCGVEDWFRTWHILCCQRLALLQLHLLQLVDAGLSIASSSVFQGQLLFQGCLFKRCFTGSSLPSVVLWDCKERPPNRCLLPLISSGSRDFQHGARHRNQCSNKGPFLTLYCGAVIQVRSD